MILLLQHSVDKMLIIQATGCHARMHNTSLMSSTPTDYRDRSNKKTYPAETNKCHLQRQTHVICRVPTQEVGQGTTRPCCNDTAWTFSAFGAPHIRWKKEWIPSSAVRCCVRCRSQRK